MKKCPHGKVDSVGCQECANSRHRISQINKALENLIRSLSEERHKTALIGRANVIDADLNLLAEMRDHYR